MSAVPQLERQVQRAEAGSQRKLSQMWRRSMPELPRASRMSYLYRRMGA